MLRSPQEFFGFRMGDDRKIARWDRIVEYYWELSKNTDRMKVVDLGKSTEGWPFLLAIISSPENLANLEHLRKTNLSLSDPRGLSDGDIEALIGEGRAVVCQTMSLHANEIGGTQMAPELTYEMLSSNSEDVLRVLDNVIFLLVPCFNPDGEVMTVDWYEKYLGTEYEGCGLPWLYQKYTGHDNNRDAVMMNLVESQHVGKILLRDWVPQAYVDHHHMGSDGIRYYIPPYCDPIRPFADPIVWREIAWYGSQMAYDLEEAGKQGVIGGAHWTAWGHLGFHRLTELHNIAGMLTESASAKLATPMYVHGNQLVGCDPMTHPDYMPQVNFPNPWPGGWWHLRDIVEQQKISAWSVLDIAARYREKVLRNAYLKAQHQITAGASDPVKAFVIPAAQHDAPTAKKLVKLLLDQGVEVQVAKTSFVADGHEYHVGSYIVPVAQPKMGVVKTLLERTQYPDYYWTHNPDGSPVVYDLAADVVSEYMGVEAVPVQDIEYKGHAVDNVPGDPCDLRQSAQGYALDCRSNNAFTAAAMLTSAGVPVYRFEESVAVGCDVLQPGAFYIPEAPGLAARLRTISGETGVSFCGLSTAPVAKKHPLSQLKVAVYQRYWGGNMEEGWTRLVLERFGIPYTTIMDKDLSTDLNARFDAIIFPGDDQFMIVGPANFPLDKLPPRYRKAASTPVPEEYRSGIGKSGVDAVKEFVKKGGRLIAWGASTAWAVDTFALKLRSSISGLGWKDFHCHGSTLHASIDTKHPLGYGMPDQALVFNVQSPAFDITDNFSADKYEVVVRYAEKDLLQSGWLVGEQHLAGKAAMVRTSVDKGEIVLIGFAPQFRGQVHGTFKLLFNCFYK